MSRHVITVDFHGLAITIGGRYREAEPEANCPAGFEIDSAKVGVILAGDYRQEELHDRNVQASVWDFLESEALEIVEAGFEAAAEEAADARREARRDAERE